MDYKPLTQVLSRCLKPCLAEVDESNGVKSFSVSIVFWQKFWSALPCLSTNVPKYHVWSLPVLGNGKRKDDTSQWKKMEELKIKSVQKWHKLFQKLRTDYEATHLSTLCPYWNILNQVVCIIQGEKDYSWTSVPFKWGTRSILETMGCTGNGDFTGRPAS